MVSKIKNLTIDEGSLVDKGANPEAKVVFFKRDNNGGNDMKFTKQGPAPGQSERDYIWTNEILPAFDDFQNQYSKEQFDAYNAAGGQTNASNTAYKHRSREQLLSDFFKTTKGKAFYSRYERASADITTQPVSKVDDRPKNLSEHAWEKLNKIAKKYQTGGMTIEQATVKASKVSQEYRDIYAAISNSYPLSEVDFDSCISKSKSDALSEWKSEIDRLARRAGV